MGWASRFIERLRVGETVSFRPHGHSMSRVESGQLCTVVPIDPTVLEVGDIVLCKVAGNASRTDGAGSPLAASSTAVARRYRPVLEKISNARA
jgi:hypothetical protein